MNYVRLVYNSNVYLINAQLQSDSLEEFREYQKNLGKNIAKRVLGDDMVP